MPEGPGRPIATALEWVGRIFAVVLLMCLPGLGGQWLGRRWNLDFLGIAGFVVGLVLGMTALLAMTRAADLKRRSGDAGADDRTANDPRKS